MANYDPPGFEVGDPCNRNGCAGIINERPMEDFSCRMAPSVACLPCNRTKVFCPECGWTVGEE